jgi:hypothetical protein
VDIRPFGVLVNIKMLSSISFKEFFCFLSLLQKSGSQQEICRFYESLHPESFEDEFDPHHSGGFWRRLFVIDEWTARTHALYFKNQSVQFIKIVFLKKPSWKDYIPMNFPYEQFMENKIWGHFRESGFQCRPDLRWAGSGYYTLGAKALVPDTLDVLLGKTGPAINIFGSLSKTVFCYSHESALVIHKAI